jgi:hypothetical protein
MSWPTWAAVAAVVALLVIGNYPSLVALGAVVGAAGSAALSRRCTRGR